MSRSTVVAFVVLMLSACGTSPPARYYALSEPAAASVSKTGNAVVLFGPFSVAQYLQRPQIVVRDANHELKLGEFDRWASASVAVVPWLARDVDRQLANAVVVAFRRWDTPMPVSRARHDLGMGYRRKWRGGTRRAVGVRDEQRSRAGAAAYVPLHRTGDQSWRLRRHRSRPESDVGGLCGGSGHGVVVGVAGQGSLGRRVIIVSLMGSI